MLDDDGDSGIFPDEIVSEILTHLPAKTITRFKCVSKRWNAIICNPNFIISYISKSSLKWVVFDRFIRVNPDSGPEFKHHWEEPPNVSTLTINPSKLCDDSKVFAEDSDIPAPLIYCSNGFMLFSIKIKRDPSKGNNLFTCPWFREEDCLYVVNPITRDWVPIPKAENFVHKLGSVGFVTEVGPTGVLERFMIVEYQPIVGSKTANLMCFSSETWKWEEIPANYMLGRHQWNGDGVVEFDGRLMWVDMTVGMIIWDEPFGWGKEEKGKGKGKGKVHCRFIGVPRPAPDPKDRRCIEVVGGKIQYLEVSMGESHELYLWRLKDCEGGDWSLVHKLCLRDVWCDDTYLGYGLEKVLPRRQFLHPYEADVAVFMVANRVFCLNLGTRKVECCGDLYTSPTIYIWLAAIKLPSWPTLFSPSLKATYLKEQGNEFFKTRNFNEAINLYSKSIASSPNTLAYSNRAMAYLKVNRYHEAEADCTEALKLDGEYFKAYLRRATARKELGDLQGYVGDVEFALKLKPDNQEIKKLYAEVKSLIEKVN